VKFTSLSEPFIRRPVATTLLTVGIALAGLVSFALLPVSPLPQVDFPTIVVSASLPGASPETMSTSVATPLERQLGRIAGVSEMTSTSSQGSSRVVLQFDLSRDIDGAARDVQAALNAAATDLPSDLPLLPRFRKANPAAAPVLILALTSNSLPSSDLYDAADTVIAQRISQGSFFRRLLFFGRHHGCWRWRESLKIRQILCRRRIELRQALLAAEVDLLALISDRAVRAGGLVGHHRTHLVRPGRQGRRIVGEATRDTSQCQKEPEESLHIYMDFTRVAFILTISADFARPAVRIC